MTTRDDSDAATPADDPDTSYKFTGQEEDESTGLYYYHARYYDPTLGCFVQADSIVQSPYDPQTLNRYAYCRNNPVKFVDPSGHFWKEILAAVGAFVGFMVGGPMGAYYGAAIGGAIGGGIDAAKAGRSFMRGAKAGALFGLQFQMAMGTGDYGTAAEMLFSSIPKNKTWWKITKWSIKLTVAVICAYSIHAASSASHATKSAEAGVAIETGAEGQVNQSTTEAILQSLEQQYESVTVEIGYRPLGGSNDMVLSSFQETLDLQLAHQHIFIKSGGNVIADVGYFNAGKGVVWMKETAMYSSYSNLVNLGEMSVSNLRTVITAIEPSYAGSNYFVLGKTATLGFKKNCQNFCSDFVKVAS